MTFFGRLSCAWKRFLPGVLVLFLVSPVARAQTTVESSGPFHLRFGGILQPRLSYGWTTDDNDERTGFGMRRARLNLTTTIDSRAGAYLQVEGAAGTVQLLDAFVFFQPGEHLRLRFGRMVSAQPRAFILTPAPFIDAIDRPAIAEIWGRRTVGGDGRDFGLDLSYTGEQGEATLFLHNGDGSWNRLRGNYRTGISEGVVTEGIERRLSDLAVSFYSTLRPNVLPGLEVGGFVGYNGSANPNTAAAEVGRAYLSYAAHLYWGATPGSRLVRIKADLIGIQYERVNRLPQAVRDQHTVGLAALLALRLHPALEAFGRVEQYDENVNRGDRGDRYLTGGLSFSPSRLRGRPFNRERLTLGYSALLPADEDAPTLHLVILQAQIHF